MKSEELLARLDDFAASIVTRKRRDFGYPVNHQSLLVGFYKWLYGSGINLAMLNNCADPFDGKVHSIPNSLPFEREVIEHFGPIYGFDPNDLWGIVTFSGTDGNNHGIYFGSKYLERKTGKKPIVYVSDAAHYSSKRLADLQNLELVVIPADVHGCMIPEELDRLIVNDRPALVVYALGTTFKGGIDNIAVLNEVITRHKSLDVYRHIDAALFGGYLPHTQYRELLDRRVNHYDSIAVSGHKFFGMDEPAGFFLTTRHIKDNQNPYNIPYLNASMPMINCSRSAISPLKLWWIIHNTSPEKFAEYARTMLETAAWLKEKLDGIEWPAWLEPMSNTVYFKRPPADIVQKYDLASDYDERLGGELSHVVVMQHVGKEMLQGFIDELRNA